MRRVVTPLFLILAVAAPAAAVVYSPPVDGPVVDGWRPPADRFGAGNRGLDYGATPGSPVRTAADGTVTFAGQVGGQLFVVVTHADGIRTTYGFLAAVSVHVGQALLRGDQVGVAGADTHFGARRGGDYIDPSTLFSGRAHLVPLDGGRQGP